MSARSPGVVRGFRAEPRGRSPSSARGSTSGVHREVDVRPERVGDAPVTHRAVRIELHRPLERAHRFVVVEPVGEPQALIEVALRLGRRRRDPMVPVAESLQQRHRSRRVPGRCPCAPWSWCSPPGRGRSWAGDRAAPMTAARQHGNEEHRSVLRPSLPANSPRPSTPALVHICRKVARGPSRSFRLPPSPNAAADHHSFSGGGQAEAAERGRPDRASAPLTGRDAFGQGRELFDGAGECCQLLADLRRQLLLRGSQPAVPELVGQARAASMRASSARVRLT